MTVLSKQNVLFLCTGNSCRSQMAEGWARYLHGKRMNVWSAGIECHGLNPLAVQVMGEAGVDISGHSSKLIDELPQIEYDRIITVCGHADEHCPVFPGNPNVIFHGFEDPPKLAEQCAGEEEKLDQYRKVCEEIRLYVATL